MSILPDWLGSYSEDGETVYLDRYVADSSISFSLIPKNTSFLFENNLSFSTTKNSINFTEDYKSFKLVEKEASIAFNITTVMN